MMTDYHYEKEQDSSALWIKEPRPLSLPGVSRFRRWLFPALMVSVILILIIAVGVSNMKTSNRLWSVEQSVSNLGDIIQSLNTSLQHTEESVKQVQKLQISVEDNKNQLSSVSEALKQLSSLDSLSRSVESLKWSLERIINNRSAVDACCPLGWDHFERSCYFFSSLTLSWNESRVWCEQQDAHLLILHADKTWAFVTRHTASALYWVGLSDWRTGKWEWVNQTPYTMERWRWVPGQPDNWDGHGLGPGNEDCAHLHFSGRLNDLHCLSNLRFICQRHGVCV